MLVTVLITVTILIFLELAQRLQENRRALRHQRRQAHRLLLMGLNPPISRHVTPLLHQYGREKSAMHQRLRHVILAPSSSGLRTHSSGLRSFWSLKEVLSDG